MIARIDLHSLALSEHPLAGAVVFSDTAVAKLQAVLDTQCALLSALQDFSSANPQPDAWLRVRDAQDRARTAFEALR